MDNNLVNGNDNFGKSKMKKIIFLSLSLFLLFSCSDLDVEDEDEGANRRKRRERNRDGQDEESDGGYGKKNVCEGSGYTLYLDECPETKSTGERGEGTEDSPNFTEDGEPYISEDESFSELKKPMDILFVLDTSDSMSQYLSREFIQRFRTFITIINRLDWRIMFTHAGYSDEDSWLSFLSSALNGEAMQLENKAGKMKTQYLDRRFPDYSSIFQYTLTREPKTRGQGYKCEYPPYCNGGEQPLRALQMSFSANKQFTRREADFVAIIITNEDEEQEEGEPVTADTILTEFKRVYGSQKKLSLLNIIVLPGDESCEEENDDMQWIAAEVSAGEKISEVAKKIGGGNFSICLKDYSAVAETIVRLSTE